MPAEAVPWLQATLRIDGGNSRAAKDLGVAKYFLGEYAEAVVALDRARALDAGRVIQLQIHAVLAAAYGRLERRQDAERERAILDRVAPFFDAERFAAQFGTQQAHDAMLAGLKAAGFR
jgi:tetratricopeptide (TPR) repeat protein